MANGKGGTVIRVDTTAQYDGVFRIKYIKCVGGTCSIKSGSTSGEVVYVATSGQQDPVELRLNGMYVTAGSGATVYIYLEIAD